MNLIIGCITQEHDLRLVLLAVVVCACGCYTALNALDRARAVPARIDSRWLMAGAAIAGAGLWSSHFVAMLAFRSPVPIGYELRLTGLSIALAIIVSWAAFFMALKLKQPLIGGALFGVAVGAMHYTGTAALSLQARFHWNPDLVVSSVIWGSLFGAASLGVFARGSGPLSRIAATCLMMLSIVSLHFIGMTALTIDPDLTIPATIQAVLDPGILALLVSVTMSTIVIIGLFSAGLDQHLARHAVNEARQLRKYVDELEATKAELHLSATELREALDIAAAASAAKSRFLGTMSHELRTPLNAVIGFSEMMTLEIFGPIGNPHYVDYIDTIHSGGLRLLSLIDDILDFTTIDTGELRLNIEQADLREIVAQAVKAEMLAPVHVKVITQYDLDIPMVAVDSKRIGRIVRALFSNGLKFTPQNGEVRLSLRNDATTVSIVIADTGIGIATEDIQNILTPFGQKEFGIGRKYGGAGLGLALSKRLVELHGGSLTIKSTPGVGTTVTVTLPMSPAVPLPKADAPPQATVLPAEMSFMGRAYG